MLNLIKKKIYCLVEELCAFSLTANERMDSYSDYSAHHRLVQLSFLDSKCLII